MFIYPINYFHRPTHKKKESNVNGTTTRKWVYFLERKVKRELFWQKTRLRVSWKKGESSLNFRLDFRKSETWKSVEILPFYMIRRFFWLFFDIFFTVRISRVLDPSPSPHVHTLAREKSSRNVVLRRRRRRRCPWEMCVRPRHDGTGNALLPHFAYNSRLTTSRRRRKTRGQGVGGLCDVR